MLPTGDSEGWRSQADRHSAAARAAAEAGDFAQAREALLKAIKLVDDPDLVALLGFYTHRSTDLPDHERARLTQHHLGRALALAPNHADAHYYLGLVAASSGDRIRARAELAAALRANPAHVRAKDELARQEGGRETRSEAAAATTARPAARRRSTTAVLASALFLTGAAAAIVVITAPPPSGGCLSAASLGTTLEMVCAEPSGRRLRIELVKGTWDQMARAKRRAELEKLVEAAKRRGVDEIAVLDVGRKGVPFVADYMNGELREFGP